MPTRAGCSGRSRTYGAASLLADLVHNHNLPAHSSIFAFCFYLFILVSQQGITIHSKDHPDDPVRCFRGKGIIPATAEVLRLHLVQVDLRKYWDDMVRTAARFCRSSAALVFFAIFLCLINF